MPVSIKCLSLIVFAVALSANVEAVEKLFDIDGFTEIHTKTGIDVEISQGNSFRVFADINVGTVDDLSIFLEGNKLTVGFSELAMAKLSREILVKIEMPELEGIYADTGSTVVGHKLIARSIELFADHGGTITLTGKCGTLTAVSSNGGSINAEKFVCDTVYSKATSRGAVNVHTTSRQEKLSKMVVM